MLLPIEVTRELFNKELIPAKEWALRNKISLSSYSEELVIKAVFNQRETKNNFYLLGRFDSYKAIPPEWTFRDENWEGTSKNYYPNPSSNTPYGSSIFHSDGLICAPFNRLAFGVFNGPHKDWGDLANWQNSGLKYIQANTIADMLQCIKRDFYYTCGHMK